MKRSYFVPESWKAPDWVFAWAMNEFGITSKEAIRQLTLMRDYEFRRPYSDWNRVYKNWVRKADELGQLKRERKLHRPEEISDEQRQADILAFENDPKIKAFRRAK